MIIEGRAAKEITVAAVGRAVGGLVSHLEYSCKNPHDITFLQKRA